VPSPARRPARGLTGPEKRPHQGGLSGAAFLRVGIRAARQQGLHRLDVCRAWPPPSAASRPTSEAYWHRPRPPAASRPWRDRDCSRRGVKRGLRRIHWRLSGLHRLFRSRSAIARSLRVAAQTNAAVPSALATSAFCAAFQQSLDRCTVPRPSRQPPATCRLPALPPARRPRESSSPSMPPESLLLCSLQFLPLGPCF